MNDDDQDWFDLMAGRAAPEARARTRSDAAWLRAAMLSYTPAPPAGAMPKADARVVRLIARAVHAGVLKPAALPATSLWQRFRSAARPARWGFAVAAVAVLAVVLRVAGPDPMPPMGAERGAGLQQIVSSQPAVRQQQLLQALRAAGIDAQPFERVGRLGVDVELPVPLPQRQAAVLRQLGLKVPAGPSLIIEIVQASAADRTP